MPGRLGEPADEQCHVSTLTAPVGVELVEDEKVESACHGDQGATVVGPGEHQLQHHVVGEQDIRRVVAQLLASAFVLLAGVASKSNRFSVFAVAVNQEFFELVELAVGQGVHRIDDDGPHSFLFSAALSVAVSGTRSTMGRM